MHWECENIFYASLMAEESVYFNYPFAHKNHFTLVNRLQYNLQISERSFKQKQNCDRHDE
jgi:hypothetical protein